MKNAAEKAPYSCPDLNQEISPWDPTPESVYQRALELDQEDKQLPEIDHKIPVELP